MHPPLGRPHPECTDIIERLVACHEQHKLGKWFGACNDVKAELDWCFRKEKELKRDANLKQAREWDAKFEKYVEKKRQMQQAAADATDGKK